MIRLVDSEQLKGTYNNIKMDFDRYNIEVSSQLSSKEYSVVVDFLNEEIIGDCIAYGSWFDIETTEAIHLLEEILKENEPIRDYTRIIEKQIQKF
jgi:hypothetical protein